MYLSKKKVIILLPGFDLGGAEKQSLLLADVLKNKFQCEVYFISTDSQVIYPNFKKLLNKIDVPIIKHNYKVNFNFKSTSFFKKIKHFLKIIRFFYRINKLLKSHKPDVLIPYLTKPCVVSNILYSYIPNSITYWNHRGITPYFNNFLEKRAFSKAPFFIANSLNGKKELINKFKSKKKKIFFLPNINNKENKIDNSINSKLLEQHSISKNVTIIGMVAHFRKGKNQFLLTKAFNELMKVNNNIHLLLIGNVQDNSLESDYNLIKKYIIENNISNNITILNNTLAQEYMQIIDIGVLLTDGEGMSNVLMEYIQNKIPVVSSDVEGCIDLLGKEYQNLVDNNKLKDVIDKINILIKNQNNEREASVNFLNNSVNVFLTGEEYVKKLSRIIESSI